jgi:hypothetical protein
MQPHFEEKKSSNEFRQSIPTGKSISNYLSKEILNNALYRPHLKGFSYGFTIHSSLYTLYCTRAIWYIGKNSERERMIRTCDHSAKSFLFRIEAKEFFL